MDEEYIKKSDALKIIETANSMTSRLLEAMMKLCITMDHVAAADVRPVVMGKWLPTSDKNKKRCSKCDVIHLIAQYPHGESNFCPNCSKRYYDHYVEIINRLAEMEDMICETPPKEET